jgi:hypothetical protein
MIRGNTLESYQGTLLARRVLEDGALVQRAAVAARLAGRFIPTVPPAAAISIPVGTIVMRPATATQAEIAFRSEAAATILASGTMSNLLYLTCTAVGSRGNAIPNGVSLSLRDKVTGVASFLTTAAAAGGYDTEDDPSLRNRARNRRRGHGETTWAGLESLLLDVELSTGSRVTSARVFEAFDEPAPLRYGMTYAILDDGTGDPALVGPEDTTYAFGGSSWWPFYGTSYHIYVDIPYTPLVLWESGVNATLERNNSGSWVPLVEGTSYWIDSDTSRIALLSPLTLGQQLRAQFTSYGGLLREAARYVNGVRGSENTRGWRPVGFPVRLRAPSTCVQPTVSASVVFAPGWDSTFGRTLAATNILAYLNGLNIAEPARYDVINGIISKVPGVDYVSGLTLNGSDADVAPTNKFGVIRGLATNITI